MFKDVVASLAVGASRDVAMDFAVSVAATFNANLTGIAFLYEPLPPMADRYGFPPEVIQSQRVENEKMAKAAIAKFDEVARRAAVIAESRMLDVAVTSAPNVFANIARRFDLSIGKGYVWRRASGNRHTKCQTGGRAASGGVARRPGAF